MSPSTNICIVVEAVILEVSNVNTLGFLTFVLGVLTGGAGGGVTVPLLALALLAALALATALAVLVAGGVVVLGLDPPVVEVFFVLFVLALVVLALLVNTFLNPSEKVLVALVLLASAICLFLYSLTKSLRFLV